LAQLSIAIGRYRAATTARQWIHPSRILTAASVDVFLDIGGEALKNRVENTARSPLDKVDVKSVEPLYRIGRMDAESVDPPSTAVACQSHFLETLIFLLPGQNFQTLHQWQASVDHDGETGE